MLLDVVRGTPSPEALAFRRLAGQEPLVLGDVVLLELLQGARDDAAARRTEALFAAFTQVPMLGPDLARRAAANYRRLRTAGITPRRMADLIIGSWCIAQAVPLLHRDRDFLPMAEHLGLRLVAA